MVENSVDDTRAAEEVAYPSDCKPQHLIDQVVLYGKKDTNEDHEDHKQSKIFDQNYMEGELDLHIINEALIDVVEQLLSLEC